MLKIIITYNNAAQIKEIKDSFKESLIFHFIDSLSKKGKKEAWTLKSYWGARLDPFILVMNNEKVIKAFYSEADNNVIKSLIKYLDNENK